MIQVLVRSHIRVDRPLRNTWLWPTYPSAIDRNLRTTCVPISTGDTQLGCPFKSNWKQASPLLSSAMTVKSYGEVEGSTRLSFSTSSKLRPMNLFAL